MKKSPQISKTLVIKNNIFAVNASLENVTQIKFTHSVSLATLEHIFSKATNVLKKIIFFQCEWTVGGATNLKKIPTSVIELHFIYCKNEVLVNVMNDGVENNHVETLYIKSHTNNINLEHDNEIQTFNAQKEFKNVVIDCYEQSFSNNVLNTLLEKTLINFTLTCQNNELSSHIALKPQKLLCKYINIYGHITLTAPNSDTNINGLMIGNGAFVKNVSQIKVLNIIDDVRPHNNGVNSNNLIKVEKIVVQQPLSQTKFVFLNLKNYTPINPKTPISIEIKQSCILFIHSDNKVLAEIIKTNTQCIAFVLMLNGDKIDVKLVENITLNINNNILEFEKVRDELTAMQIPLFGMDLFQSRVRKLEFIKNA